VLSEVGRREEALQATQEAVEIRRELARANPQAFLPDLAMSLNNLGHALSSLGRREEALAAAQEAVDLYRELARANPQAFLPDLAMSLNNLARGLSDRYARTGRLEDLEQAIALWKRAVYLTPEGSPDQPVFLNNLGNALRDRYIRTGDPTDFKQAADCYQRALVLSLALAPRFVLETAREAVNFGKVLVAQDKAADAVALVGKLDQTLDKLFKQPGAEQETVEAPPERDSALREPAPAYQPFAIYDSEVIQVAALLKDMLSVIASVASVRINGSSPAQYEQALQALEIARQVDRATGGVFELTQWVRETSGYEFVELEEADRWPPRLAYLVQLAARYERDENWAAAIDAYSQARNLINPNKGAEELERYTELGFRLGLCLKQAGRWSEALKQQEENVAGYKKLGNLYGKASAYLEMGHIYQMMNIYDLALLYYGEAYYLYRQAVEEAPDEAARRLAQRGMADAKESLGDLEFQLKVLPKGLTDLEEAEKLYATLGMPGKAAIIRQTLESAQMSGGGTHD